MRFLRRKVHGTETVREEGSVIHREIEITVEREWLAVPYAAASRAQQEAHPCPCCGQTISSPHALCSRHAGELALNPPPNEVMYDR
jgi:hypothetical protein